LKNLISIILAAGSSSRLGQPKQNLIWKGELLLDRAIRLAIEAGSNQQFVVFGANQLEIKRRIQSKDYIEVDNPNWEKGMGESLKAGIRCVKEQQPNFDLAMILLVDMPRLEKEDLKMLVENAKLKMRTTATYHDGGPGVPVVFKKEDLFKLDHPSEKGAQSWLATHQQEIDIFHLPNASFDVDTPEDWEKLRGKEV
jgi:molybdenum cofactor cytidylyltransferase